MKNILFFAFVFFASKTIGQESLSLDKGSGYPTLYLASDGDGTHNDASTSITNYGYGGSSDFNFKINNWGGFYNFRFGATGGAYDVFRISRGGGGGNGPDQGYGFVDVLAKFQEVGVRLNGQGNSYFMNGNVGIGTTTPSEKLSVNGTIRSKEVKVEANNWPDYVFSPEYNLKSLEETETYIKENQRLPDMPSAEEVAENGVALGNTVSLLLEKIEELTLHTIQQQKEIEELKKQIQN